MPQITGTIKHPKFDIEIEVLKPEEGEYPKDDYNPKTDGRLVQATWENMNEYTTSELKEIAKWIAQSAEKIESDFKENGSKK